MPFTLQVTAVFEDPDTVTVKAWTVPTTTEAVPGDTTTATPGAGGGLSECFFEHAGARSAAARMAKFFRVRLIQVLLSPWAAIHAGPVPDLLPSPDISRRASQVPGIRTGVFQESRLPRRTPERGGGAVLRFPRFSGP
jgi:hypothetical protein